MILDKIKEYYHNIKESFLESKLYYSITNSFSQDETNYVIDCKTGQSKYLCTFREFNNQEKIFIGSKECVNCKYCRGNIIKIILMTDNRTKNYLRILSCRLKCCYNKNIFYKIISYLFTIWTKNKTKYRVIVYD